MPRSFQRTLWPVAMLTLNTLLVWQAGCTAMVRQTDAEVSALIEARQKAALGAVATPRAAQRGEWPEPTRAAYSGVPQPTSSELPDGFAGGAAEPTTLPTSLPASQPTTQVADVGTTSTRPANMFTLTDALAYAQSHRREFITAQEDLYLAALALTLERHLWTPVFASSLRTVYGNYGEARNFDQAMRMVADLSVTQRLPLGGEFTAAALATLIRDVKKTITAEESGQVRLALKVPLLRGAGHVARETLIQLERELTYAVRTYERFRRQQLVTVAQGYFDLVLSKQFMIDTERSYGTFVEDYERAKALEQTGRGSPLDTMRAEQAKFGAENAVADARERFRADADNFKLLIGMPVDQPLGHEQLEDIESIERRIIAGEYPALLRPPAVADEEYAVEVALRRRLDLLTLTDRIDDARRGVSISRNALLPDLNWSGSVTLDTDREHYNVLAHEFERANWLTELVLGLPLERTSERNALRRALISVDRAERGRLDLAERIRAEVRRAVNRIMLADRSVEIQQKNVYVAERRQEYAKYRFEEVGDISNRDKVEAETDLLNARNRLNAAKTARWNALLQFRLATETLLIDENGRQNHVSEFDGAKAASVLLGRERTSTDEQPTR